MADKQKDRTVSGKNDVINLTKNSFKRKKFPVASAGIYQLKITRKSKIRSGPNGNYLELHLSISKGEYKGKVSLFDTVSPSVDWKVAQLLSALGIKKFTLTLAQLLKMATDKELRASLRVENYNGKDKNKVVQFLPLKSEANRDETDDDSTEDPDDADDAVEPDDDDPPADDDDDAPADDDDDAPADDDDDPPADDDDDLDPDPTDDDDDAPADDDDEEEAAAAAAKAKKRAKLLKEKERAKAEAKAKAKRQAAKKRGGK